MDVKNCCPATNRCYGDHTSKWSILMAGDNREKQLSQSDEERFASFTEFIIP